MEIDSEDTPEGSKNTETDNLLLVWERAIQTQMHFAELSIKTRQLGMTVVGATLGLAIVLNRSNFGYVLTFCKIDVPITTVLCFGAAAILYAMKLLDVGVYHQMLRGAVAFNEDLESKKLLPIFGTTKGLTQAISFFSRHPHAKYIDGKFSLDTDRNYHFAGDRIIWFYRWMIGALILAGIALKFSGVK